MVLQQTMTGWVLRYPGWDILTSTLIYILKILRIFFCLWIADLFLIVLEAYIYGFDKTYGTMFHQRTMRGGWGGGGQDTLAWVSWPHLSLFFWKFEVKKVFLPVKGWFVFNCNSRITLHLYLTKPKENGSSADNNRGWGSRYPGWGILTPTIVCILKILRFFFACEWLLYFQLHLKGIFTDLTKPVEPC